MDKSSALLRITGLQAWYGQSHVLHGVSLEVARGEIVSILGRNGAGRSTLLKAVMGQVRSTGEIDFEDRSLAGLATYAIAQRGVGYVPESRDVFPALTVQQNLLLGRKSGPVPDDGWREEEVLTLFPSLERRYKVAAGALSGGEQQMLALGLSLIHI